MIKFITRPKPLPIVEDFRLFSEIPNQDNPAFDDKECLMIILSSGENQGAKFTVLHVIPNEDPYNEETITRLAMFWKVENARIFAEAYSNIHEK